VEGAARRADMNGQLKMYSIRRREFALSYGDTLEIRGPDTDEVLAVAVERPGIIVNLLALFPRRSGLHIFLPNKIVVSTGNDAKTGEVALTVYRRVSPFRPKMVTKDKNGNTVWTIKGKNKGWGYEFRVLNISNQEVGQLSFDYRELAAKCRFYGVEIGSVVRAARLDDRRDGFDIQLSDPHVLSHKDGISAERSVLLLAAGFTVYMLEKGPED
jgi:hypothetical protein